MIFLVSLPFFAAVLACITILERKKPSPHWKRLNLALALSGVLIVLLCRILAGVLIGSSEQSETWMTWAHDMLSQHYVISLPVLFTLTGILLAAWLLSLTEKRRRSTVGFILRRTVGILASSVLFLLAPMYAFMTENEFVPLDLLIVISGFGEALIVRIIDALEAFFPGRSGETR